MKHVEANLGLLRRRALLLSLDGTIFHFISNFLINPEHFFFVFSSPFFQITQRGRINLLIKVNLSIARGLLISHSARSYTI